MKGTEDRSPGEQVAYDVSGDVACEDKSWPAIYAAIIRRVDEMMGGYDASWQEACEREIAAEREACAKVAEKLYGMGTATIIADAIRKRTTTD